MEYAVPAITLLLQLFTVTAVNMGAVAVTGTSYFQNGGLGESWKGGFPEAERYVCISGWSLGCTCVHERVV